MRRPPSTPIASARSGRVREQVLKAALGASSMVMVAAYALGLVYLLARGGGKVVSSVEGVRVPWAAELLAFADGPLQDRY